MHTYIGLEESFVTVEYMLGCLICNNPVHSGQPSFEPPLIIFKHVGSTDAVERCKKSMPKARVQRKPACMCVAGCSPCTTTSNAQSM